jgi:hypothetical protein
VRTKEIRVAVQRETEDQGFYAVLTGRP